MNFVEVIKECENAGGAGTKKVIQAALGKADEHTRRLVSEALNPYRVFGIRKYDLPKSYDNNSEGLEQNLAAFYFLLDELCARNLTGNAAKTAVQNVLSMFTKEQASYLSRVFDKDLKAGFSAETASKVWKDCSTFNIIPSFEVMLADKCESAEDFEENVPLPSVYEVKLDGERTIAIVKSDSVIYYSRSGKEAIHVNGLFDEELFKIRNFIGYDFILDGERYASNFTETMNAKKEGNSEAKNNLKFYAYFIMPLIDWLKQDTCVTMINARNTIAGLIKDLQLKKITNPIGGMVSNYAEMMKVCDHSIDELGFEGLILKNPTSTYKWERSFAWTKVKRMYDVDCKVVGTYKGRPKSRLENVLGGISVVGFLESGERVEVNVGSGFSDEDRLRDDWVGKVVVIKYQEVSRSKGKSVASLRFPVYMHTRDDKNVEV